MEPEVSSQDAAKDEISEEKRSYLYETEKLPSINFYRAYDSVTGKVMKRPTIKELRSTYTPCEEDDTAQQDENIEALAKPKKIVKLGWFTGVMVRCLLALFGAILFLRLPWVIGNAGLVLGVVIIVGSGLISLLTALSLATVATNGKVKAGGTYFLLSRTLGADFGGPIGVTIAVTDLTSSAMVIIAVAEVVQVVIRRTHSESFFLTINGVRVIGLIVLLVMAAIIMIGLDFESIIMRIMLAVLVASFFNFVVGWFLISDEKRAYGFTGFSLKTLRHNLLPDYIEGYGFITVFAVFFPAMTGILAGVNISGNLRNPQVAIPRGTLWATNVATLVYAVFGIASSAIMCRGTSKIIKSPETSATTSFNSCNQFVCRFDNCTFGLKSTNAMVYMSGNEYVVYAGMFAATLSSASALLVSGPKVFQAVCRDNILPGFLKFFAVGHSKTDEPQRLYLLNFILCGALVCIGSLNSIALLLTNFVLLGYAFINFACFYASFAETPGWRPTFKYYNKYVALFTSVLCVVIMFLVQYTFAILTILVELILYLYVKKRNPIANWGSSSEANNYRIGLSLLKSCEMQGSHAKTFRPQCLILSGWPESRLSLIKLINKITKSYSLTICGNIITDPEATLNDVQNSISDIRDWFATQKIHAFYIPVLDVNLRQGARALMQCAGFGVVRPNILVMGFKDDWMQAAGESTNEYFQIIRDAFDMNLGVVIVRLNKLTNTSDVKDLLQPDDDDESVDVLKPPAEEQSTTNVNVSTVNYIEKNEFTLDVSATPNDSKAFIDIWWLFEDGGLTILFPYLLSTRKSWRNSKLRIFIPCMDDSQRRYDKMAHMLNEFRIPYQSIKTISDFFEKPKQELVDQYAKMIEPLMAETSSYSNHCMIHKDEMNYNTRNIEHYIKLKELLLHYSKDSALIFVTLPVPREQEVGAGLYLSWLEFISKDLPSVLFIRGNQNNVLTYYT